MFLVCVCVCDAVRVPPLNACDSSGRILPYERQVFFICGELLCYGCLTLSAHTYQVVAVRCVQMCQVVCCLVCSDVSVVCFVMCSDVSGVCCVMCSGVSGFAV